MSPPGLFARTARRPAARRWCVPAVALLALLGQTSALLHRALVQHATCAEHGESVHVAAAANAPVGLFAGAAEQSDLSAPIDGEAASDHHEHCAAADSRSSTTRLVPDRCTPLLAAGTVAVPVRDEAGGTALATYLLAPKTSPPRRAS